MWADALRIVDPFDGDVDCVGAASEEPFAELLAPSLPHCANGIGPGTPDRTLLSVGVGEHHVWVHKDCLGPWLDTLVETGDTLVKEPLPF